MGTKIHPIPVNVLNETDKPAEFVVCASEVGLTPGEWPRMVMSLVTGERTMYHRWTKRESADGDLEYVRYRCMDGIPANQPRPSILIYND